MATSTSSRWLKSTEWLAGQLGKAGFSIVDGSYYLPTQKRDAKADYLAGHIPGATFFDINSDNWFSRGFATFGQWFPNSWLYFIAYALLTMIFTYFYTAVTFNPKDIAENLKKNGGYIQGVRPGPRTEAYISRILERTTFLGALYLASVAVVPSIMFWYVFKNMTTLNLIGGTSILIMVGVALDTVRELDARLTMLKYESALG